MIKKLYNFFKKFDYRIKFLMVGALNTAVGLGSYWLFLLLFGVNLTQNNSGLVWQVVLATVLSQILGLINSYFWNKFFTFESKKKSKTETFKFVGVYLIAFSMDYILKIFLRRIRMLNEIVISIITIVVTTIISFVGQKFIVFKYKKQASQADQLQNVKANNVKAVEAGTAESSNLTQMDGKTAEIEKVEIVESRNVNSKK